jgi:glycosyltransferase involved in cell wall biosynthesis
VKVTGFTFIRNALIYDYPIREAIRSVLPLCDEFLVAVGNSDDATLELIEGIGSSKIRIIETVWDDTLRANGEVLAVETNKALRAISKDSDWCFYIQGDEVLEEGQDALIRQAMEHHSNDENVDGFLFKYRHFYGSYDYVGASNSWYQHEIRIVRNMETVYSYKDAQGFRKGDNEKLRVIELPVHIHHYGWVKEPKAMQQKQLNFNKLWHDDTWVEANIPSVDHFEYEKHLTQVKRFEGKHPALMRERIEAMNWSFNTDISMERRTLKDRIKDALLLIGINPNYVNYKKVGTFGA